MNMQKTISATVSIEEAVNGLTVLGSKVDDINHTDSMVFQETGTDNSHIDNAFDEAEARLDAIIAQAEQNKLDIASQRQTFKDDYASSQ